MDIQLRNVKEIVEVNSTYINGELKRKFISFIETYDSMGLKIDDVSIDLGGHDVEAEREEDLVEISADNEIQDVPSVWVLIDDEDIPRFKPIKTDARGTDFSKAVSDYGIDIILLKTEFTEKARHIKINFSGVLLEKKGTFREIQQFIINSFEYVECREQLLKVLKDSFFDIECVHSFLLTIPEHKEHIVIGLINAQALDG